VIHAILRQVHDPLFAAVPLFLVFIVIESVAYMFERDKPSAGRGALPAGLAFGAVSLVLFTALYVYVAPWHAPTDQWSTWVILFFLVDFRWYRLVGAAHQTHLSSKILRLRNSPAAEMPGLSGTSWAGRRDRHGFGSWAGEDHL